MKSEEKRSADGELDGSDAEALRRTLRASAALDAQATDQSIPSALGESVTIAEPWSVRC